MSRSNLIEVPRDMVEKIFSISEKLSSLEKDRDIPPSEYGRKLFMENFRSTSIDYIKQIVPIIQGIKYQTSSKASASSVSSTFLADQHHVTLNLDDAVQVLRSITQSPSDVPASSKLSAKDIDAMVNRKFNALLSVHKSSGKQFSDGKPNNDRGRQEKRSGNIGVSRKRKRDETTTDPSDERCFDCVMPLPGS